MKTRALLFDMDGTHPSASRPHVIAQVRNYEELMNNDFLERLHA